MGRALLFVVLTVTLSVFVGRSWACHPACHWVCDAPECRARCHSVVAPPNCSVVCVNPAHQSSCDKARCAITCEEDEVSCETDACPNCQVLCEQVHCSNQAALCDVVCSPPEAHWECTTPLSCPKPVCDLQCDAPACAGSDSEWLAPSLAALVLVAAVVLR